MSQNGDSFQWKKVPVPPRQPKPLGGVTLSRLKDDEKTATSFPEVKHNDGCHQEHGRRLASSGASKPVETSLEAEEETKTRKVPTVLCRSKRLDEFRREPKSATVEIIIPNDTNQNGEKTLPSVIKMHSRQNQTSKSEAQNRNTGTESTTKMQYILPPLKPRQRPLDVGRSDVESGFFKPAPPAKPESSSCFPKVKDAEHMPTAVKTRGKTLKACVSKSHEAQYKPKPLPPKAESGSSTTNTGASSLEQKTSPEELLEEIVLSDLKPCAVKAVRSTTALCSTSGDSNLLLKSLREELLKSYATSDAVQQDSQPIKKSKGKKTQSNVSQETRRCSSPTLPAVTLQEPAYAEELKGIRTLLSQCRAQDRAPQGNRVSSPHRPLLERRAQKNQSSYAWGPSAPAPPASAEPGRPPVAALRKRRRTRPADPASLQKHLPPTVERTVSLKPSPPPLPALHGSCATQSAQQRPGWR